MKELKIILLLIFVTIITSCSASKRFTAEKDFEDSDDQNLTAEGLEFIEQGIASYYADEYHGKKTASGEIFNMNDFTAAHPYLEFGVKLLVKNLKNNKTVLVRINDRMPNFKGRVIDLSLAAAKKIDMISDGTVEVKIYKVEK
ncbi:septal ring lytic transglycosylase RlpA family protein [Ignavibacterium album]|uniref:septal ring lytic transglycosylase RlpA family protein n=1 Tax=Ignavibacterium album TaxID=591197 RepID=UPI0026EDEA1A|nr:septal ring lytic transglycosylase RlpA family protein [Ignavibacterium album]